MRRVLPALAVLLCTMATATACGDDSDDGSDAGSDTSPSTSSDASADASSDTSASASSDDGGTSEPTTIEITFSGDTMTPSGERIEVEAGQPVDLVVTADQPGEIHVHSTPEQEIAYDAGTETFTLKFDRPGIVEVESHDLEKIIVQLEVR